MMNQISPVVKQLLLINVIVFVVAYFVMPSLQNLLPLYYPTTGHFKPFQIVTNIFMHGDANHLLFNMISLFFLGPWLEGKLGAKKFLILYIGAGLAGVAAHFLMIYLGISPPVGILGASGSVMGILAALAYFFPNQKVQLLIPPIPIKISWLAIALICYDLYAGVSNSATGIAHYAHLGGALCGLLLAFYFQKTDQSFRRF